MSIYVENDVLKCGPYGNSTAAELVLTYDDIKPFSTTEWQHITCIYMHDMYVKG